MSKNPPIGTCPCPIPKCSETCEVRRFKSGHTKDTQRRYAGKWYLVCPAHGRLGMDGRQAFQDWIADNAHMHNAEELRAAAEPAAATPAPAKPAATPAPAAAPAAPASSSSAPKQPATPTPRRSSADFDW